MSVACWRQLGNSKGSLVGNRLGTLETLEVRNPMVTLVVEGLNDNFLKSSFVSLFCRINLALCHICWSPALLRLPHLDFNLNQTLPLRTSFLTLRYSSIRYRLLRGFSLLSYLFFDSNRRDLTILFLRARVLNVPRRTYHWAGLTNPLSQLAHLSSWCGLLAISPLEDKHLLTISHFISFRSHSSFLKALICWRK